MKLSSHISCVLTAILASSPVWAESPVGPASLTPGVMLVRLLESDGSRVLVNSRTSKGLAVQVTDANGTGIGDAAVVFRFPDTGASATFADGSHSVVVYTDPAGTARISNFQWNDQTGPVSLRVTATKAETHAGLLVEQTLVASATGASPVAGQPVEVGSGETAAVLPEPPPVAVTLHRPEATAPMAAIDSDVNPYRIPRANIAPAISINSTEHDSSYHVGFSKKKWIILGIVAGVGAGAALAIMSGKSSSSAAATSGVSVGTPTITIGHP